MLELIVSQISQANFPLCLEYFSCHFPHIRSSQPSVSAKISSPQRGIPWSTQRSIPWSNLKYPPSYSVPDSCLFSLLSVNLQLLHICLVSCLWILLHIADSMRAKFILSVHICVPSAEHSVWCIVAIQEVFIERMRMNISIIFFLINGGEEKCSNTCDSIFKGVKNCGKPFHFLIPEALGECNHILMYYYEKC